MRDEVLHLTKGEIPPVSRYFSDKEDFMPTCEHGVGLDGECSLCKLSIDMASYKSMGMQGVIKPFATQVGGDHYTKLPIQPMEYSMKNNLDACQHTIIKYVTRFRDKNGIEDLEKAKHVIDMLIAYEKGRL